MPQDDDFSTAELETETTGEPAAEVPPGDPAFTLFARFSELIKERKVLEDELDEIKETMDRMQPQLLSYFQQNNMQRLRINKVTIYVRRDLWARAKDKGKAGTARVIEALRASGMGHYVYETFSVQSLSAHVRELERQHASELADGRLADTAQLLPSQLANVLEVKPSFSVQGRRSS